MTLAIPVAETGRTLRSMTESLVCLLQTISGNMDINRSTRSKDLKEEEHGRNNLNLLREYLNCCEQTISRNMDVKGAANEGPEGNEEMLVELEEKRSLL